MVERAGTSNFTVSDYSFVHEYPAFASRRAMLLIHASEMEQQLYAGNKISHAGLIQLSKSGALIDSRYR
jgi:hypothetical protein